MASVHLPEGTREATDEVGPPSLAQDLLNDELLPPAAWEMLHYLYANDANGKKTEICDLTSASCVPSMVARRHLERLIDLGFVETAPGTGHRFRQVSLLPDGFAALRVKMAG